MSVDAAPSGLLAEVRSADAGHMVTWLRWPLLGRCAATPRVRDRVEFISGSPLKRHVDRIDRRDFIDRCLKHTEVPLRVAERCRLGRRSLWTFILGGVTTPTRACKTAFISGIE